MTARACEADDDVLGPRRLDLEPGLMVENRLDHAPDVVSGTRVRGHDLLELVDQAVGRITRVFEWSLLAVARRKVGEKRAHRGDACGIVGYLVVADTGLVAVHLRAPHVVVGDILARRGLDQSRATQRHR